MEPGILLSQETTGAFFTKKQKNLDARLHISLYFYITVMILDRQVWANRGVVWSGSTLFASPSALFTHIILWKIYISQI